MTTESRSFTPPQAAGPDSDEAAFGLFLEAGRRAGTPPADLMARILGDAASCAGAPGLAPALALPERRGLFAGLIAALGGWPALGGMAAATMAGVWLGFTTPSLLEDSGVYGSDYTIADLMPSSLVMALADPGAGQ